MKKLLSLLIVGTLVLSGVGAIAFSFDEIKTDFQWEQKGLNNILLNDDELDQYQIVSNYAWPVGPCPWWQPPNENYSIAQSFIPTKNILTRVQILIGKNRTAIYPYVLAIREELTGDDIAITSVDVEDIATETFNWTEFDFADLPVTTGQTYYMVSYTTDITDNWYGWGANYINPYPNGTMAVSLDDGEIWEENDTSDMCFKTYGRDNNRPNLPDITGEINGKIRTSYEYTVSSIDPDGDNIAYYLIVWGDETHTNKTGPFASGEQVTASHKWTKQGTYKILVRATDVFGKHSPWGTLDVTMPRTRAINKPFLLFLQNHLNLFLLLQKILVYLIK